MLCKEMKIRTEVTGVVEVELPQERTHGKNRRQNMVNENIEMKEKAQEDDKKEDGGKS